MKDKLKKLKALVFDVDGVFTDGGLLVGDNEVQRLYNAKDGYAVQIAIKKGLQLAIITGGKQESIRTRLGGLGIKDIFISVGISEKLEVFDQYILDKGFKDSEVLYIGDDLPDIEIMRQRSVFSAAPNDAVEEVLSTADYITKKKGGKGAVREVIKLVMKSQDLWPF